MSAPRLTQVTRLHPRCAPWIELSPLSRDEERHGCENTQELGYHVQGIRETKPAPYLEDEEHRREKRHVGAD